MNRKLLGIAVTLLAVAMLASPVVAIGPQNAEKNPNAVFDFGWAMLNLPSGQLTEWVPSEELGTIFFQHKNAADFQIRNAEVVTIRMATTPLPTDPGVQDMYAFFGTENQWIYLSQNSYFNFLFNSFMQTTGNIELAITIATDVSNMYPDGLYIRFVMIGN